MGEYLDVGGGRGGIEKKYWVVGENCAIMNNIICHASVHAYVL
jgi:hypothetical protein